MGNSPKPGSTHVPRLQLELLDPLTDVTTPEGSDSDSDDEEEVKAKSIIFSDKHLVCCEK